MAYVDSGACSKEPTITGLVKECRAKQGEIRAHLSKLFERNPIEVNAKPEGRPQIANVLDEIMEDLRALLKSQGDTIDFIRDRISSKL